MRPREMGKNSNKDRNLSSKNDYVISGGIYWIYTVTQFYIRFFRTCNISTTPSKYSDGSIRKYRSNNFWNQKLKYSSLTEQTAVAREMLLGVSKMNLQRSPSSRCLPVGSDLPKDEPRELGLGTERRWRRDKRDRGPRVAWDAGSDESEVRGRNELADGRDEPVYSRPTFPSGTSNLNSSHPYGASSSSGPTGWRSSAGGIAPPVRPRHRVRVTVYLVFVVQRIHWFSRWWYHLVVSSSSSLPPSRTSEIGWWRSSPFRKPPLVHRRYDLRDPLYPTTREKPPFVEWDWCSRPGSSKCQVIWVSRVRWRNNTSSMQSRR